MIPNHAETQAWMAAWRESSDPKAGRALIDAFYPFVASLIRRHVDDLGSVEDLTQQTFVRCLTKIHQWESDKPLEPWLAKIAVNLCRDHFRSQRIQREWRWSDLSHQEQAAITATLQAPAQESSSLHDDSRALMLRLLGTLSADDRMVISLLYLENKTTEQISKLCGWSRTLVKVRAFRARRKLRQAFEQLERSRT